MPDEGSQHADDGERQQPGRGHRLPVELRIAQTQRLERLDLLRPDHLSIAYDGLTPLVRLLHGRHRLARILLRSRRGVLVQHLVRAHEALHQLHDDRPIRLGKHRADVQRDLVAELVDAVVGDAVLHDVLERALRLVGDGRPAVIVQNGELTGGRVAERRGDVQAQRGAFARECGRTALHREADGDG